MSRFNILITDNAKCDIINIIKYIETQNKFAALNLSKIFKKTFILLSEFPAAGRNSQYIKDKDILIYIVKKRFIVAYRFVDNKVVILRILSSYQDICGLL
ncbi:MAG: type II toxin-antitoxin system RelE/ParE family toxin [Candidatus Gastranaerophilales bacterium]|nr:type II toxin-antitoxin system RelE/ParE family toxin [Candidatus Gastranaerophilales bacterium]